MKNIVVGIDFSELSNNVVGHAIDLATKLNAKMVWVWAENKKSISKLNLNSDPDIQKTIYNRFEELKTKFAHLINSLDIEFRIEKGNVCRVIKNISEELNSDFVVIGAHDFFGMNLFRKKTTPNIIISNTKSSVLTVKEPYTLDKSLKTIIVPIDSSFDTRQKLPIAIELALAYDAEIHLLGIYLCNVANICKKVEKYMEQAEEFILNHNVKKIVTHYAQSINGAKTVMEYATKVNAGLIVTMSDPEKQDSDFWYGSRRHRLVNQSEIPILSIPNKETIKTIGGL